jgi:hypothetical protein
MKPMIWHPDEEHDRKVNEYLDRVNRAPYELIYALILGVFCLFTFIVLLGIF